jgi:hypothetical protein
MKKTIIYISVLTILIITFKTNSHAWPIPHSGVTKCYDNEKEIPCPKPGEPFYGQSGNYIINPKSYTKLDEKGSDLPDDAENWFMVRDNVTELIWEVKQAKDDIHDYSNPNDSDNEYIWYDTDGDSHDKVTFLKQINESHFGGFDDWRLPSMIELGSLVAHERFMPAINELYFKGIKYDGWWSGFYWSSITHASRLDYALGLHFPRGGTGTSSKVLSQYVCAVHEGHCQPFHHLIINADKTVTDTSTGLIWAIETSEKEINWKDALKYCETYFFSDYSDWRLPQKEELRSISKYNPAINSKIFNTMSAIYWSSTSYAGDTGDAWGVVFNSGIGYNYGKDSSYYVRSVRGGQCRLFDHLYIWSPKQAAIFITNTTHSITWDTANIEGNVKITLSRQGGKADTFETIAPETQNDGHYDWTITGQSSPNCMLKIEPISFPYSGTQQSFFTIKNPDMKINTNVQSNFTISGPESFTGKGHSYTIDNALPGTYTITYAPDACWQTPAKESQSLTYWGTLTFDGVYSEIHPDPIQNLRADREIKTWTGNNQIHMQWKPVDECLTGYAFVWDQSENTIPGDVITGTSHQTISPPLGNDSDHWFHIKSINIHGNASETAHLGPFYIDTSMLPKAPDNLVIAQNTSAGIQLKWIPIDTVASYTIYRSQREAGVFYPIHSAPVDYYDAFINGFWDTGIMQGKDYYYKIKSWQSGLESLDFSNTVAVTTPEGNSGFDIRFIGQKHDIVPAGTRVVYDLLVIKTEAFEGYLDMWCSDLPDQVSYELSVDHQSTATRLENIQLLPTAMTLAISTGSAALSV